MEGSVLMVSVPGMFPVVSKEWGNALFRATIYQAAAMVGSVASARFGLGMLGVGALRDDLSQVLLERVGLWGIVASKGSHVFAVFLKLLD